MRTDVATSDGRHGVVEQLHGGRWIYASSPEALAAAAPWLRLIWGEAVRAEALRRLRGAVESERAQRRTT